MDIRVRISGFRTSGDPGAVALKLCRPMLSSQAASRVSKPLGSAETWAEELMVPPRSLTAACSSAAAHTSLTVDEHGDEHHPDGCDQCAWACSLPPARCYLIMQSAKQRTLQAF